MSDNSLLQHRADSSQNEICSVLRRFTKFELTQTALVAKVVMLLRNPGFLPLGVTRLYTHSLSHMLVLMFHESKRTLKLGANSITGILMFAAPCQSDWPVGL